MEEPEGSCLWGLDVADNWRPLFAIAQTAGGDWPRRALEAFNQLTTKTDHQLSSIDSLLLLGDLRQIFTESGRTRLASQHIVNSLRSLPDRPWGSVMGTSQSSLNWLARQLRPFGISSRNIRDGELRAKGYDLADFTEAFASVDPAA